MGIIIPVPTGSTFRATLEVNALIPVACEHCGCTFVYRVKRRAEGRASAPLFLGREGAKDRARQAAVKALEKELLKAVEPVPCPRCSRYQAGMVSKLRRKRIRYGWLGALLPGIVWILWAAVVAADTNRNILLAAAMMPQALVGLVTIGSIAAGHLAAARLDPEEHARQAKVDPASRAEVGRDDFAAIKKVGYVLVENR